MIVLHWLADGALLLAALLFVVGCLAVGVVRTVRDRAAARRAVLASLLAVQAERDRVEAELAEFNKIIAHFEETDL